MPTANTVLENGGRVVLLDKSSFCSGNGANRRNQREKISRILHRCSIESCITPSTWKYPKISINVFAKSPKVTQHEGDQHSLAQTIPALNLLVLALVQDCSFDTATNWTPPHSGQQSPWMKYESAHLKDLRQRRQPMRMLQRNQANEWLEHVYVSPKEI